jgi:hypothetical protein
MKTFKEYRTEVITEKVINYYRFDPLHFYFNLNFLTRTITFDLIILLAQGH